MILRLDRNDLKPEHKNNAISNTYFDDFKEEVQAVIRLIGRGTIFEWGEESYNAIYPTSLRVNGRARKHTVSQASIDSDNKK